MQLEIDTLKKAAPERTTVETPSLTKRFCSVVALDRCTITVPRGRISALIGHNSAGKTTLLRILCGLARPSEGSVSVLGHTPGQGHTDFLPEISFPAQDIPLYRRLTAPPASVSRLPYSRSPPDHLRAPRPSRRSDPRHRGPHGVGTPVTTSR